VAVYLVGMLALGFISARRSATSEYYFVGHRDFPGWVIGFPMLGSIICSTTFLALPAAAYVLDWRQLIRARCFTLHINDKDQPALSRDAGARFLSVDALRGFDMFWIVGGDFLFRSLQKFMIRP